MIRSPWSTRPSHRCWIAVRFPIALKAMVFLEAESCGLSPREGSNWGKRSTQPGDLPPGLNVLRLPRPVNTDAPDFPLRHTASQCSESFFTDMILTILASGRRQNGENQRPAKLSTGHRCRFIESAGILTCCPSVTPFGLALGPTNPTPMTVAWETLGIRRASFSLA